MTFFRRKKELAVVGNEIPNTYDFSKKTAPCGRKEYLKYNRP